MNFIECMLRKPYAILEAVELRIRPILMTAGAVAVGMIPIALEWAVGRVMPPFDIDEGCYKDKIKKHVTVVSASSTGETCLLRYAPWHRLL